ncbi:hypothetical protein FGG08_006887 [Glutinoglossum americanum]|uniref:NACHT domain-containing protein n=1 Tax=Glutinoglossum americanum TaxID=1670608 RepID=A0A9P8I4E2_9PEZI|nr:hypothetical protein FGG08_006887 [Glutinoglossum americanum]
MIAESDLESKCRTECLNLLASNYREDKDRNPDRVSGTCKWFLDHPKFRSWCKGETANLLWVSADPGCGKSVLSKALIDEGLLTTTSRRLSICYFFFKDDDVNRRNGANALCAILHQLFMQKPILIEHAVPHFKNNGSILRTMSSTLWDILKEAATDPEAGEIICVLDALDECEESAMEDLVSTLGKFYSDQNEANMRLKFLITSRPYYNIECAFSSIVNDITSINLKGEEESEKISQEIDLVIQHVIPRITGARRHSLNHEVQDKSTPGRLRALVNKIPLSVADAYEKILGRIKDSGWTEQAKRLLNIIVVATRPLTLKEMNLALAIGEKIERGEACQSYDDLELDDEQQFKIKVRNLCGLFVSIIDSKVYLIHQTAKEFLICKDIVKNPRSMTWEHSLEPGESNFILAKICISYLLFDVFESQPLDIDVNSVISAEVNRYTEKHHFLDYAAKHWAFHFKGAGISTDTALLKSVLDICYTQSKRFLTWFQVYWITIDRYNRYSKGFSDLTVGSYFGHDVVVKYLLEREGVDVNRKDGDGRTPLSWAAERGHLEITKLLVGRESVVDVNNKGRNGRTPLSWAAEGGHPEIVKLLVKREDVDVNHEDGYGRTPLSWAAGRGHLEVVKLLLKRESANVNHKDGDGRTPLSWAAGKGHHLEIVKLLVEREGVDINSKDRYGRTPLSWAAGRGHLEVVKLLAEREGVNVNSEDGYGLTPLSWAAERGHLEVVKLLVGREGVDVNHKDWYDRTPLSWAAGRGHLEVVELLVGRSIDMNSRDRYGRTPLSWAARRGRLEIVKLLVGKEGADVDSKGRNAAVVGR